ncbi:MAG: FAD:protein FMN transferase [Victivallaceae bacterium]|nr:FAD:protein FMN transferase [Victivallaceae bacterium]
MCEDQKNSKIISLRHLFLTLGILAALGCFQFFFRPQEKAHRGDSDMLALEFPVMGTCAEIVLYGKDRPALEKAAAAAQAELVRIESIASAFRAESDLSKVNASAADRPVAVGEDLWKMLQLGEFGWSFSEGLFDPTAGKLVRLWGFKRKRNTLPTPEETGEAARVTGWRKVKLLENGRKVSFLQKGVDLDLGALAKGYAVDCAVERILREHPKAAYAGLVNVGGNIRCFGTPPDGAREEGFRIEVRDPFREGEAVLGSFQLKNAAVATSGSYERFVTIGGRRYSHIFNPKTLRPAEFPGSVTVVAPEAGLCDVLSTAIYLGRGELARKTVERFPGKITVIIWESPRQRPGIYGIFTRYCYDAAKK